MSGLRCWPQCLAEFVPGTRNAGRRVFVLRKHEEGSQFLGRHMWWVAPLQPCVGILGQQAMPGDRATALDEDLRPILPPPAADSTHTTADKPQPVEAV